MNREDEKPGRPWSCVWGSFSAMTNLITKAVAFASGGYHRNHISRPSSLGDLLTEKIEGPSDWRPPDWRPEGERILAEGLAFVEAQRKMHEKQDKLLADIKKAQDTKRGKGRGL